MLISLECRDNLIQLRNALWTKDIQGRVIERYSPVGRRTSFETDLSSICDVAHFCFQIWATAYAGFDAHTSSEMNAGNRFHVRRVVGSTQQSSRFCRLQRPSAYDVP